MVRALGHHYQLASEGASQGERGFGGKVFEVRFFDGRVVVTHNLWHQGEVPAHFRARLPDNAVFAEDPDMKGRRMG